jgi:hypothetical protein
LNFVNFINIRSQKEYSNAKSFLDKRLKLLEWLKDYHGIALVHQQIGELLLEWKGKSEEEARSHFTTAVTVAEDRIFYLIYCNLHFLDMFSSSAQASYRHLGLIASNQGSLEDATTYFEKALSLAQQAQDTKGINAAKAGLLYLKV